MSLLVPEERGPQRVPSTRKIELRSRIGDILRADLRVVETGTPKPVVIFLHGFKGFKDWGPFPAMMEKIAEAGFVVLSFNFSHNGIGPDLQNFTELDRFAENTFSKELDEVIDVVRIVKEGALPCAPTEMAPDRIGLLGHSRGAGMAILAGAESNAVKAVAALSPVSHFDRYSERQKAKWRSAGVFEVLNQRTKQVMRLNSSFLDDLEANIDRLDILKAAAKYPNAQKPLFILSGEQDLTTPTKEAEATAAAASGPLTKLRLIPQTGHTFGAEHPYKGMTRVLESVLSETICFFKEALITH